MISDLINKVIESDNYKEWKEKNLNSFLSHLFSPLDNNFNLKSNWDIGFYNSDKDKIVVFTANNDKVERKKEDQVFKKEDEEVEKLNLNEVKINFEKSLEIFKEKFSELYPNLNIGDGFVTLQTIKGKTLWNFTFITKTLQFVNIKIDASIGELESHQTVELLDRTQS